MAIRSIITAPDSRLKVKSAAVAEIDDRMRQLIDDMFETMYAAPGIGLSAIQIGVPERVVVIDVARDDDPVGPLALVNPEILWSAEETMSYEEGCLSLPDQFAEIDRATTIEVRYLDRQGEIRTQKVDGVHAACLQHEIDHLSGKLFVDYLSSVKRNIILRKLAKVRRLAEAPA
jgi:peptide deformylase